MDAKYPLISIFRGALPSDCGFSGIKSFGPYSNVHARRVDEDDRGTFAPGRSVAVL